MNLIILEDNYDFSDSRTFFINETEGNKTLEYIVKFIYSFYMQIYFFASFFVIRIVCLKIITDKKSFLKVK